MISILYPGFGCLEYDLSQCPSSGNTLPDVPLDCFYRLAGLTGCKPGGRLGLGNYVGGGGGVGGTASSKSGSYVESLK